GHGREGGQRVARSWLAFTGLDARAEALPDELNLLERKFLDLARALASEPRLVLLDEVLSGLTPSQMTDALQLVRRIRDRGPRVFHGRSCAIPTSSARIWERPMLEIERLEVAHGDAVAVWDVSLRVGDRELVTVVGPNGAGKTTLIDALAGLLPIRSGSARLDGRDLASVAPHDLCRLGIALVPEGRRLFPAMTVEENLEIGCYAPPARKLRGRSLERVYAIFPLLRERRQQLAGSLSGGQQQMVAIGRALMAMPRLLLLDEPSLGLAPHVVDQVFEVIAG